MDGRQREFEEAAAVIAGEAERLRLAKSRVIIAIDGRCASGKTTLAAMLGETCGCPVIHMDHFFLRPEQRTAERLREPGGNVDRERFLDEVLIPLKQGTSCSYRPYDCHRQELTEAIRIEPGPIYLIEGSYSCHPSLYGYYDFTVFLTVNPTEQLRRIRERNGEGAAVAFEEKWIPLEERYFSSCLIEERCDMCFELGKPFC